MEKSKPLTEPVFTPKGSAEAFEAQILLAFRTKFGTVGPFPNPASPYGSGRPRAFRPVLSV